MTACNSRAHCNMAGTAWTTQSLPLQPIVEFSQIAGNGELWGGEWVPCPARYGGLFDMGDLTKSIFEAASSGSNPYHPRSQHGTACVQPAGTDQAGISLGCNSPTITIVPIPLLTNIQTAFVLVDLSSHLVLVSNERFSTQLSAIARKAGEHGFCLALTIGAPSYLQCLLLPLAFCITALHIHGIAPEPLSPALIQFAWHPYLVGLLNEWLNMNETGDISQFGPFYALYHDMQVVALCMRNQAQHKAMAPEMLYYALIGSQPPSHVELMNFFTGLRLPFHALVAPQLFFRKPGERQEMRSSWFVWKYTTDAKMDK
ncbi:hypothetical protein B0H11DRAFT_1937661 [Mycena galericulata]|nr:hypothetical protein B0H11DRAFT_1937661 [Mycena galericulata]